MQSVVVWVFCLVGLVGFLCVCFVLPFFFFLLVGRFWWCCLFVVGEEVVSF